MRHNVELPELDRYRDYLRGHLRDHHFPQLSDNKFIEARVEDAYDRFITERLQGRGVSVATELSYRTLLDGLYVSPYDIVYSVLEENLWTRLPEWSWPSMADHLVTLPSVKEILDRYGVNGDFLSRENHRPMLAELLGVISEIRDGYEL